MRCPRCPQPGPVLAPKTVTAVSLEECPGCVGLWIATGALRHVLHDPQIQEHLAEELAPAPDPGREIHCPECSELMTRTTLGEVMIDVCPPHGAWFDRDELEAIARAALDKEQNRILTLAQLFEQILDGK